MIHDGHKVVCDISQEIKNETDSLNYQLSFLNNNWDYPYLFCKSKVQDKKNYLAGIA